MLKQIGQEQTLTSLEVAEMVGKTHKELLRDIHRYEQQARESNIALSEFWNKSTYKSEGQKRSYPCYNITIKGCEFIAHKLTGSKGTEFTAKYINRFHDMENALLGSERMLPVSAQAIAELVTKQTELLESLMNRIDSIENKLEAGSGRQPDSVYLMEKNCHPGYPEPDIVAIRAKRIATLVKKVAKVLGYDKNKVFRAMYMELEDAFDISLDAYLEVAKREYREDACTLHVVAMWDRFYEFAVNINENTLAERNIYERGKQYE